METTTRCKFEVGATSDYSRFKRLTGNRNIYLNHVKRLVASIEEYGLQTPVRVYIAEDGDWMTLDGQHRIEACKELQIPVPYIVDTSTDSMSPAEAVRLVSNINHNTKKWNAQDYLQAYAEIGKEDYIWLRKFLAENGVVNLSALIGTVLFPSMDRTKRNDVFQQGEMRLSFERKANTKAFVQFLGDTLEMCERLPDCGFDKWKQYPVKAIYPIWDHDNFDTSRWFERIQQTPIRKRDSIDDYKRLFLAIYNKYLHDKNKIDLEGLD